MKKIWSKRVLILLVLSVGMTAGAYVFQKNSKTWANVWPFGPQRAVISNAQSKNKKSVVASPPRDFFDNPSELQACYESYLSRDPEIQEGSVLLHMTIDESGGIHYLKLVKSDMVDEDFAKCVVDNVQSKKITPTAERMGVVIAHRFKFRKRDLSHLNFE